MKVDDALRWSVWDDTFWGSNEAWESSMSNEIWSYCWWFTNPAFTGWGWWFFPIIDKVSAPSQVVVWDFWTINSITSTPSTVRINSFAKRSAFCLPSLSHYRNPSRHSNAFQRILRTSTTCMHQNYDFQKIFPIKKKNWDSRKNRGEPKVPQFGVPNRSLISIENSTTTSPSEVSNSTRTIRNPRKRRV